MPKKRDANRTHAFQYFGLVEWAKYHLSTAVPLTFCQLFIHFISIVFLITCLNFFFRVHSERISLIHLPIFETHSEPSVYGPNNGCAMQSHIGKIHIGKTPNAK